MKARTQAAAALRLAELELRGSTDAGSAHRLRRLLATAENEGLVRVIIDLHELEDLADDVCGVLLEYDQRLTAAGGWLHLVHHTDNAGEVLRRTGLHDRLRSSPSREAAAWLDL